MPRQFAPEFRQRALGIPEEAVPEHETEYATIRPHSELDYRTPAEVQAYYAHQESPGRGQPRKPIGTKPRATQTVTTRQRLQGGPESSCHTGPKSS